MEIVKTLAFFWVSFFACFSFLKLKNGSKKSIYYVIFIFYFFCAVPLILDVFFGKPSYVNQPGFYISTDDVRTNYLYCFYVCIIPVFLLFFSNFKNKEHKIDFSKKYSNNFFDTLGGYSKFLKSLAYIVLVFPVFFVLFLGDIENYLIFGSVVRSEGSSSGIGNWASGFCNLSVLAAAYILLISKPYKKGTWPNLISFLIISPFIFIDIWIHGKRTIVALIIVSFFVVFQFRGILKGLKGSILMFLGFIIIFSYSNFYQNYFERYGSSQYENLRIDFGRDDVIKMSIWAELNPSQMQILEYRGQSVLFYLTAFVPRSIWPSKPFPYAQYVTSAMLLSPPKLWGWGMTTSWLEEAISNFGWFGMFLGPFLIGIICRIGDSSKNIIVKLLTPIISSLFIVVHAVVFIPLIFTWIYFYIKDKFFNRNNKINILKNKFSKF